VRAVYYGSADAADLVRLLVDNGADINAVGNEAGGDVCSPLWWAAIAVGAYTRSR